MLLDAGANARAKGYNGWAPLHVACELPRLKLGALGVSKCSSTLCLDLMMVHLQLSGWLHTGPPGRLGGLRSTLRAFMGMLL